MASSSSSSRNKQHYPSHFKTSQDQDLIRLALHKSPFFTCLDHEQVERLVSVAALKTFEPGQVVILEGCVDEDDTDESNSNVSQQQETEIRTIQDLNVGPAEHDEYLESVEEEKMDSQGGSSDDETHEDSFNAQAAEDPSSRIQNTDESSEVEPGNEEPASEQLSASSDPDENDDVSSAHDNLQSQNGKGKEYQETRFPNRNSTNPLPPPPRSGIKRSMYIVRKGSADVWYQPRFNPASLGPGTLFGEGGFLFGRQHSASVVAGSDEPLECFVVDISTFRDYVLPSDNMAKQFARYAKRQDETGIYFMTMEDLVKSCEEQKATTMQDPLVSLRIANTYNILRNPASSNRIYLDDFCFFHLLMARPDPEVDIAFLLMDKRQTGQIYLDDLRKFLEPAYPDLDLQTQFFQRYFGQDGNQSIRDFHFSQFLVDLQREMGKQAFLRAVQEHGTHEGYLAPQHFVQVLKTACGWRLPHGVADRLESIYCQGPIEAGEAAAVVSLRSGSLKRATVREMAESTERSVLAGMEQREKNLGNRYFAYGDFVAFQEVLGNLPGICNLIDRAQEIKQGPVSPDDFKVANRIMGLGGRLSRRQVDIIFQLFDLDHDGYVSHEDTVSVCGVDLAQRLVAVTGRSGKLTFAPPPEYKQEEAAAEDLEEDEKATVSVISWIQHFSLTAVAGAIGVMALYPLDLVKTRLMNQRITLQGGRMYANSFDCLRLALRTEHFFGLYRGLSPQLLGVAPEKAIKLQVNELLRQAFSSNEETDKRKISLVFEALAGACAGACQLLVTNPMEITKIRLQLQGETSRLLQQKGLKPPAPQSLSGVVRDLGFSGIWRGASACLLRDIPFSAIYFPAYAACKDYLVELNDPPGKATPSNLLLAGTLAGVPAALVTTPADVIKTRLQVIARPGEVAYNGIRDCATKVYQQEGLGAFFQGSTARILRIAPQFGISLLAYEQLAQWIGHGHHAPPTNVFVDPTDYRTAFPARAIQPKTNDIDRWIQSYGTRRNNDR